jgi:hypothetical protein
MAGLNRTHIDRNAIVLLNGRQGTDNIDFSRKHGYFKYILGALGFNASGNNLSNGIFSFIFST